MAVTLAGFLGLRLALTILARPRYLPARTLTYPLQGAQANPTAGDWVVSMGIRDASGKLVANGSIECPPNATGPGAGCGANLGIGPGAYNWQLYQPPTDSGCSKASKPAFSSPSPRSCFTSPSEESAASHDPTW